MGVEDGIDRDPMLPKEGDQFRVGIRTGIYEDDVFFVQTIGHYERLPGEKIACIPFDLMPFTGHAASLQPECFRRS